MKWFKHASDAHKSATLEKVLIRYGAEGYALYWMCLECIAAPIDHTHCTFELEHDAEVLAHRLKVDSAKVEEIMRYFVQLGLFEVHPETQIITCLQLARQLENSVVKNPALKKIQQQMAPETNPGKSRKIRDRYRYRSRSKYYRPFRDLLESLSEEGRTSCGVKVFQEETLW